MTACTSNLLYFSGSFRFNRWMNQGELGRVLELRSNSGDHSIELRVTDEALSGWIVELTLRGVCWSTHDTSEALLKAHNVLIESRFLKDMADRVGRWVELPLNVQADLPLQGSFVLVDGGDQHLELHFGPRADFIPAGSNPILTAIYKFGRLRGEFSFLTDQSCLRLWCEGIG